MKKIYGPAVKFAHQASNCQSAAIGYILMILFKKMLRSNIVNTGCMFQSINLVTGRRSIITLL